MIWSDLRKYKIDYIVQYINEKIKEYGSLQKTAISIGTSESNIRRYLNTRGYKRVGSEFVLKDDTCNHREHTPNTESESNTSVINFTDIKESMIYLSNETETLKDIIEWFKNKDDKSNTSVIEIREGIKIDLPESNIKRTTIRINSKVWDMFNELVEGNKPIDKHDLMGMALLEYINKYK